MQTVANSTGPGTNTGRTVSALNSTKHGVLSEKTVSGLEDEQAYESLRNELIDELRPQTALESPLVERLAKPRKGNPDALRQSGRFFRKFVSAFELIVVAARGDE